MSYELYLFRCPSGADPRASAEEALAREEEEDEINPGEPDPEKEAAKKALAAALITLDPELEVFPFDYVEIARFEGTSEDEARRRHRHRELNGPDDGPGIQITLFDDTASVTLPYWHDHEQAVTIWWKLFSYLKVLERAGGFRTYAPQLDEVLDLAAGMDSVLERYAYGVARTDSLR